MITADMISDEVVAEARKAWLLSDLNAKEDRRAAIAAALNAWHSSEIEYHYVAPEGAVFPAIILPLPQKEQAND